MHIGVDLVKIAAVSHRSAELIQRLVDYPWEHAHEANLNETRGIWLPFRNGQKLRLNYNHFKVSEREWPILDLTLPFLIEIKKHFPNHRFMKGEIYNCPAKTSQDLHVDPKILHRFCRRLHLPLLTNDSAFLTIGHNQYHLEPYHIYDFNNMVPHGSYNAGDTTRIHIVVDLIEESVFNRLDGFMTMPQDLFDDSKNPGTDLDSYIEELKQIYPVKDADKNETATITQ